MDELRDGLYRGDTWILPEILAGVKPTMKAMREK
jgi:hypothetical protein